MIARKPAEPHEVTDREWFDHMTVNGRHVRLGQGLKIKDIRGDCVFHGYTRHESGAEWVDVSLPNGNYRTVRPERITTVRRIEK